MRLRDSMGAHSDSDSRTWFNDLKHLSTKNSLIQVVEVLLLPTHFKLMPEMSKHPTITESTSLE